MTHAYTKSELVAIADDMGESEVLLADMYDREHFNMIYEVALTPTQWKQFIVFYSEYYGLESLEDEIDRFIERYSITRGED